LSTEVLKLQDIQHLPDDTSYRFVFYLAFFLLC
jgi:hypothetical protein